MIPVDYPEYLVKFDFPDLGKEDFKQEAYNADPENNDKPVGYEYPPFTYELEEAKETVEPKKPKESEKQELDLDETELVESELDEEVNRNRNRGRRRFNN